MRIERDRYEQVLNEGLSSDLDHWITVDARGYSPEVADMRGEEYLDDEIVIFGPEQYEEGSELMDEVYEHEGIIDGVTDHGPLVLDTAVCLDYEAAAFVLEASIREDEGGYRSFEQEYERMRSIFDDLEGLEAGRMMDSDEIDALMADVGQYRDLYHRFEDRELPSVLGRVPLDVTQGRLDGQSVRLRDGTIRVGSDVFSLDPVVEEHNDRWTLRHATDSFEGVLDTTAGLSTVEDEIHVLVGAPGEHEETNDPQALVPVDADSRDTRRAYDDTPVMASLRTETGNIAVAITDNIAVEPLSEDQMVSQYGKPPEEPSYTVIAEAEHRIRAYYLQDMEVDQSAPTVAGLDTISLFSGSHEG